MTIPNILTLLRLVLVIPFCFFVTAGLNWDTLALVTFVVAAATDWFDGYYARRFQQFSDAGKLLDPLADKLLVATALIALAADPIIQLPVWTVVVIIGREFLITGLRSMLASQQVVMAADQLGKAKAACQMAAIVLFLVARSPNAADRAFIALGMGVYYLAVVLTIASGLEYVWRHRQMLMESFKASNQGPDF